MQYLHTMIRVGDLDQALRFFIDGLGLKEQRRYDNEAGRYTLIFLTADEDEQTFAQCSAPALELTYNWDESRYGGGGRNFGHVAFRVDDIYQLCSHLMAQGIAINRPPRCGRMAFVRSPDGISVELLQRGEPLPPAEPWLSMPNIGEW